MIYIDELKASTIEALKQIYTEKREVIEFMQNSGTDLEKAIALIIIAAGGEED